MSQKPPSGDDSSLRIFVRRGALRRFAKLKREASNLPLAIEWDRRTADRRNETAAVAPGDGAALPLGPPEGGPHIPERRNEPPFTWKLADFVLVGAGDGQTLDPEAARRTRKRKPKPDG